MQRYRVNYRLLTGLAVGVVTAAPAIYGLWWFQVDRNATRLLAQADAAETKGDHRLVFENLSQYVRLRRSEDDAQRRLGQASVELFKVKDLELQERSEAYFALIEAVERTNDDKLRRELVDIHMQAGYLDRAIDAIDALVEAGKGDAKLLALKAKCLYYTQRGADATQLSYELIGYDPQAKTFDESKGRAPREAEVYLDLARYLLSTNQRDFATEVANQLVKVNPESREAFLFQYQLHKALGDKEAARTALDQAFKLDPHDAGVLQAMGQERIAEYQTALAEANDASEDEGDLEARRAEANKFLDQAGEFFAEGMERYPDNINFYEHTARIAMYRERADEALQIAEQGLKKFDMKAAANSDVLPAAIDLASLKVDLLFFSKNIDGVRAVIKELRDLRNTRVAPIADFYAARIEAYNQNWAEAARQFAAVKIRLIQTPQLQAVASVTQGSCHLQLGQPDLAAEAYEWALERMPDMPIAKAGLAEARRQRGQMDTEGTPLQFDQAIAEELNKPAAEQNWPSIEAQIDAYVVKQAEAMRSSATWIKSRQALLRAQMYVMRATKETDATEQSRLFELARNSIRAAWAEDRNDVTVQIAAIKMMAIEPKTGPAKALQRLDETLAANKKRGVEETPMFRLLRLELLMALRSEDLPNQLNAATTGMESWTETQQAEVWAAVASRFDQLGRYPDAQLCYLEAIKLSPGALPYRIALFELARKQADDGGMKLAQERILEIVKDKTAPDYVLTEVKRMIVAHATGDLTVDQLKPARAMLEEAIRRRPGWSELYILSGQLYTVLEKDMERAVTALNSALDKGQANMGALNLQIRLLADMGRFADARKIMDRIPEANWAPILDRTAANVLRNVGEVERAFQEAKRVADANPNDPATQVWFAEITVQSATAMTSETRNGDTLTVNSEARDQARNERLQIAETALKAAIANNEGNPDLWAALINHYMKAQRPTMVERTLRDAQLVLDEEFLALLTANQLRVFGRYSEAEPIFLSSYRADIDKLPIAQRLAEFYLSWAEHDAALRAREAGPLAAAAPGGTPVIRDKAVPHINRILRAASEDKALASDPVVSWARVQAARLFSVNNDYQDSLRAERMLASAVEANAATPEVQQMLVDILNRRGDPASRERAVTLLRKIQASRGLQANYELLLGQALFDVAPWPEAERQMQEAIGRHPQDLALRVGLIEMHIARKDETAAQRLLNRLEGTPEGKAAAPQLRIRLAAAVGKKDEVRSMLVAMTPNLRVLKPEQLPIIRSLALLAESVGDTEYALQLMSEHARRVPGNELQLAHYTALYGDLDAALTMLKQLFPANIDQVLSTAVEMHRRRRAEDPAKLTPDVERFVRQARRDDPDAARRMVLEAEFLEIEQKFDEAIAAYRQILARDDVPRFVRATALNNLAFLLAMTKQDLEEALAGVDEAIQILGPISDVLDTRALVYIHSGQFDKAAADLRSAVKMNATASKYFHLTQALLGAGDETGAVDAWKQAETRGLAVDKVPNAEQDDFEATRQKIETLRSSTAQL